jgi:hypothetical protein
MIQVEGLSTTKCFADLKAVIVDDFDGRERLLTHEELAQHTINNPKMITDWRNRKRAVRLAKEYLEAKRYTDQRDRAHKLIHDKLNPLKPEPKLAHNQIKTESGLVITVPRSPSSFKRRL